MSVVVPHKAIRAISESDDPKSAIQKLTSPHLDKIEIIGDMVLVGIYVRPEKTKGGIFLTDTTKQEDIWQGKVGLVLKWGPDAFVNPSTGETFDQHAKVGEWCVFKVGDGWSLNIGDAPCRLVKDVNIRMKVKDPSIIL